MIRDAARTVIQSVTPAEVERYVRYLGRIKPDSNEELFRRWLFAFASVHTTWKLNCKLYDALKGLEWLGDKDKLLAAIKATGAGLHNNRSRFIHTFSEFFWAHPDWFWKTRHEDWHQYRDRIQDAALGIGRAKSSFVVEMTYPDEAEVICTDTHVMQLYGRKPNAISQGRVSDREEAQMERHWVSTCKRQGLPPALARWVFWDRKQGYADSRYWSFVFEQENYHDLFSGIAIKQAQGLGPDAGVSAVGADAAIVTG